jgi:uncharacterized repeat protein (TIGR04052 family)
MRHLFPLLSLYLSLTACGGGSDTPAPTPVSATQDVTIQFAAIAGPANTPVACGALIRSLGSTPTDAQLSDLRFYLTSVALVDAQGTAVPVSLEATPWQFTRGTEQVALIDLENAQGACGSEGNSSVNAVLRGKVPPGNYVKLQATLGVPERLNHTDVMSQAAPLDIMAMGWSWQTGRKFAKIELNPVGGVRTPLAAGSTSASTYQLHLASTDCSGNNDGNDTCTKKNLAQFSINFQAATQQVALDLAELFRGTDIRSNQGGAVGCMSASSDPDCNALFSQLGLDLGTGGPGALAQSVFRAIPK